MPPTLIGLAFHDGARPEHLPFSKYYDLTSPNHALLEWRIVVQGAQLLLVSPPGWVPGFGAKQVAKEGPCTIVQIPRARCDLYWSGAAEDVGQLERGQWPPSAPVHAVSAAAVNEGVRMAKEISEQTARGGKGKP